MPAGQCAIKGELIGRSLSMELHHHHSQSGGRRGDRAAKRPSLVRQQSVNKLQISCLALYSPLLFVGTTNGTIQVLHVKEQFRCLTEVDCSELVALNAAVKPFAPQIVALTILSGELLAAITSEGRLQIYQFRFSVSSGDFQIVLAAAQQIKREEKKPDASRRRSFEFKDGSGQQQNITEHPEQQDGDSEEDADHDEDGEDDGAGSASAPRRHGRAPSSIEMLNRRLDDAIAADVLFSKAKFNIVALPGD